MQRETVHLALAAIIIIAVVSCAVFAIVHFLPGERVVSPHIEPVPIDAPLRTSSYTFPFEDGRIILTIPLNESVYLGARNADKSVTVYGNISDSVWRSESYRGMIDDPTQDEIYRDLLEEFGRMRASRGLSDDEYLELIVTYVQSLKYETIPDKSAKFPVETIADGSGDCDDKSLLLAGLLSREGYKVALLSFPSENHMAIGVGSDDFLYRDTGYAFVETTNFSFIGVPTTNLDGGAPLESAPLIIPVGTGTKTYGSGKDTQYINEIYLLADARARELEPQVKAIQSELRQKQGRIEEIERRMANLKESGNIQAYNSEVPAHNALIADYNTGLSAYRSLFARYQGFAEVHNFILLNTFDRKGVYQYIRKNLPG